ncbi:MAG: MarR family transcriptional regulator [Candidatus Omnitrophica bacterium]|nr:MarR family transcriptional regulator [Candidatus Omnitrophota bacterium]
MAERDNFIRTFREIQPKFSRLLTRILTKADLTLPQFALLNQLVNYGTLSMTEASDKLGITKPAVTNLVDRLEKSKCLKRLPHSQDRRVSLLEIQPRGEQIVRDAQAQILPVLLKTLDRFGDGEKETIARFYSHLSKTLDEVLEKTRGRKK